MTASSSHPSEALRGQHVSHSLLHMWRAIICIAHADGHIAPAEAAYFEKIFANLKRAQGLTAEQENILRGDLKTAPNLSQMMAQINDPAIRANVIYFAGLLARIDGELDVCEEEILKKLHADQMTGLDLDTIRAEVHKVVSTDMAAHDAEIEAIRKTGGAWMNLILLLLKRLGIDPLM